MKGTIILKDRVPFAAGSTQLVFEHPHDPRLLIKIRNIERLKKARRRKIAGILGLKRKHGLYTTWMRELEHYFAVRVRLARHPEFLQHYHGVVDTDLGLGMVVGKVTDRAGNIAPPLGQVIKERGFTADMRAKLLEMLRQTNELGISTNDISPWNIVCGWDEAVGERFVLIEGIGVNTFIPLARFSRRLNIVSNNRHFARAIRLSEELDRRRLAQAANTA